MREGPIFWGDIRGRSGPEEGEEAPPYLALGAGGACSPLRVGNGRPCNMAMYKENWGQIVH
jgi:hypothetical protein